MGKAQDLRLFLHRRTAFGGTIFVRSMRTFFEQEIIVKKTLFITAAISLALSSTAFAGGTNSKRSSATHPTASEITLKDCEMLTVKSARAACMQSAVRGNGGIDAAAVGMTSDAGATGQVSSGTRSMNRSDGRLTSTPSYSSETNDPATYSDSPR